MTTYFLSNLTKIPNKRVKSEKAWRISRGHCKFLKFREDITNGGSLREDRSIVSPKIYNYIKITHDAIVMGTNIGM